jgi:ABC-type transport system involved in Fe-S cluster assembly fused permease/ATPase subunit
VVSAVRTVKIAPGIRDIAGRAPEGLDAQVGEGGVLLSGGEGERLAIARTLLAGSPILLLDEPTSNLDARNEHALRQAINAVSAERTLLIVAHRLSTVVDADQTWCWTAARWSRPVATTSWPTRTRSTGGSPPPAAGQLIHERDGAVRSRRSR